MFSPSNIQQQNPNVIYPFVSNTKQKAFEDRSLNAMPYNPIAPVSGQPVLGSKFTPGGQQIDHYPATPQLLPGMPGWINPDQALNPSLGGTFNLMDYINPNGFNGFQPGSGVPNANPYMLPRNVPMAVRPAPMQQQPSPNMGQPMPVPIRQIPQPIMQPPQIDIKAILMQEIAKQMMVNGGMI